MSHRSNQINVNDLGDVVSTSPADGQYLRWVNANSRWENQAGAAGGSAAVATDAIWDAKGDLAVATGADAAIRVAVGANNNMLMADSAQSAGVKWATPAEVQAILAVSSPFYNALDYGVVRDTVADQSANIQGFINTVSASGGGVCYFPEGTYWIKTRMGNNGTNPPSDTLFYFSAFGVKSNMTILGDGPGATIFKLMDNTGPSYASTTLAGAVTVTSGSPPTLGSSTISLTDASSFPNAGTGLMVDTTFRATVEWTSKTGNNLNGCTGKFETGGTNTYDVGDPFTWEARKSDSNRLITNFNMGSPSGSTYNKNIQLRNFTLDGNATNQATTGGYENNGMQYGGIFFRSVENFVIDNVEIIDWRGTASSGSDETFGCMLYSCLNGRIVNSTAHGSTNTVSTSEGWQQQHSHGISYSGVVAYWCNKSQGFAIWKSDNTAYSNCFSFLNNKRGFNQEDCEGTLYTNCIAGGFVPDTAQNEGPFTSGKFGAAGASLGNGDFGFSCNTSQRATYVNCVAQKNAQDGIVVHQDLSGFPSGLLKNVLFVNCRFIDNDAYGMEIRDIEAEREITMIQCQVSGNGTGGLQLVDSGINLNPPSGMTWEIIDWPGPWPRTSAGDITAKRWDRHIVMTNTTTASVTLPPVAVQGDHPIFVHATGSANVVVDGNASETIYGSNSVTLNSGKSISLYPLTSTKWGYTGSLA